MKTLRINEIIQCSMTEHVDSVNIIIHGPHMDEHGTYYVGAASTMELYNGSEGSIGDFLCKCYVPSFDVSVQSTSDMSNILHAIDALSDEQFSCLVGELGDWDSNASEFMRSMFYSQAYSQLSIHYEFSDEIQRSALESLAKTRGFDNAEELLRSMSVEEIIATFHTIRDAVCNTHDVNAFILDVNSSMHHIFKGDMTREEQHDWLASRIRMKAPWWKQVGFLDLA